MKKTSCLILCLATLATAPAFAQQSDKAGAPAAAPARALTKFNLDFRGGTPAELVVAIQKAVGRPVNVIVPDDLANWKLPPLKMSGVDVAQLFRTLEQAGQSREMVAMGSGSYQQVQTSYGFRSADSLPAAVSDDSIWYFYVNSQGRKPKVSRFYLLTPYLDAGLTVDDITTAIQTGWRMRGEAAPPALSFHKETKLLIAVGEHGGLDTIDAVLNALEAVKAKPAAVHKPADDQKTKR